MKEALKGEDIEAIKSKKEELTQSFYKVSEELYKQAAAQAQAQQVFTGGSGGQDKDTANRTVQRNEGRF